MVSSQWGDCKGTVGGLDVHDKETVRERIKVKNVAITVMVKLLSKLVVYVILSKVKMRKLKLECNKLISFSINRNLYYVFKFK